MVPLTGKTERLYPSEALLVFDGKESKAMADQLASVSKARRLNCTGTISQEDTHKVEEAIKILAID